MNKFKKDIIIGALLHDIGKVVYRARNLKEILSHSEAGYRWVKDNINFNNTESLFNKYDIENSIHYHHRNKMPEYGKGLKINDKAFIVSLADHISAGADRRLADEKHLDEFHNSQTTRPLESIFSSLNRTANQVSYFYNSKNLDSDASIKYPSLEKEASVSEVEYESLLTNLNRILKEPKLHEDDNHLNSLINSIRYLLKYCPSDTRINMQSDISLADHLITTAGIASVIYDYFESKNITNYYQKWDNEKDFFNEKAFLLFSFDFSGIQQFIFDITIKNALKNMRTRSFYLEILGEYLADNILTAFELTRANVIYIGGGHSYILLPNITNADSILNEVISSFNKFLLDLFDYKLFVGSAYVSVTANDLMSKDISANDSDTFRKQMDELFKKLSDSKRNKYNGSVLKELNEKEFIVGQRECTSCGKTTKLLDKQDICETCNMFIEMSSELMNEKKDVFVVSKVRFTNLPYFVMPNDNYLFLFTKNEYSSSNIDKSTIVFTYIKNDFINTYKNSASLFMCDYAAKDSHNNQLSIEDIIKQGYIDNGNKGIKRIAVMKADVDNLGETFKNGFSNSLYTISRMTSLSSYLSLFFKYYMKDLLKKLNITVIYSGGDDIYLVGYLPDIKIFSKELYESFDKYTISKLHFSAGIGIFKQTYPIYKISEYVEQLESSAKSVDGKNAVCIFSTKYNLKWNEFFDCLDNEYKLLEKAIDEDLLSSTMLYNSIYKLMQDLDSKDIDVKKKVPYKIAYLLGRIRKDKLKDGNKKTFESFSQLLFECGNEANTMKRIKLLVAIQYYMYINREGENNE
ncbi:MAG: type III-A CRISPR-associated protein Cas10/Csm1 [Acholeplasmatales bacterium]|jgi:CRISPR-associated protein Csm1|nr:type III-A CRISPR-associated protein Cas10/Csm1 [Acholeplasmatales bacterium]